MYAVIHIPEKQAVEAGGGGVAVDKAAGRRRECSVGMCGNQLTASNPGFLRLPGAAADVTASAKPDQNSAPHQGCNFPIIESGSVKFFCSPQIHTFREFALGNPRHLTSLEGARLGEKDPIALCGKRPIRGIAACCAERTA
ncbi:hypothetical protein StoSoilB22_34100 [Arthrobacter sp. StoSoilB22]|nr:hypothetical protein StoSoilB22_34100 [Arthrobacter sp. StoSoilB22]